MEIDVASTSMMEVYHLLIGIVVPRPIAWVTTVDRQGRVNLAPYSFFNVFGANPAVVVFSSTLKRDGSKKDTLANVEATGEFVLNASVEDVAEAINLTASELPAGESEAELAGLSLEPSLKVVPPRIVQCPAHLECRLREVLPIGTGPGSANLVIGEVVAIHVRDEVLDEKGRIDPRKLRAVGRLNGDFYSRTTDLFEMGRPG